MRGRSQSGLTLVELLIAITIVGIISAAAAALLSASLQAHQYGTERSSMYQEGLLAMERMTSGVRTCTALLIPNGHTPSREVLAFSGATNDDGDAYFDDPLFPRIDEDGGADASADGDAGIGTYDDDGDGGRDEGGRGDDDEDGVSGEDPVNGVDDDGDGSIDEDPSADANGDGAAGILGMDDDGDGSTDEGSARDDDEDGASDEDPLNPVIYAYDSEAGTLTESVFGLSDVVLSQRVSEFDALYEPAGADHGARVRLSLTLTDGNGGSISFTEYVFPRNLSQKCGRRVR